MARRDLEALATAVEAERAGTPALAAEALAELRKAFPNASGDLGSAPSLLGSTDAALHLVDRLAQGWQISIRGVAREPDGSWTCTIRETDATDELEVLGVGMAPSLSAAILAAILRIGARRGSVSRQAAANATE